MTICPYCNSHYTSELWRKLYYTMPKTSPHSIITFYANHKTDEHTEEVQDLELRYCLDCKSEYTKRA